MLRRFFMVSVFGLAILAGSSNAFAVMALFIDDLGPGPIGDIVSLTAPEVIIADDADGGVGTAVRLPLAAVPLAGGGSITYSLGAGPPANSIPSNTADGFAGDGIVSYTASVGVFTIVFTAATSKPNIGPGMLDLVSLTVTATGKGNLLIGASDSAFSAFEGQNGLYTGIGGTVKGGRVAATGFIGTSSPTEFGKTAQVTSGDLSGSGPTGIFSFEGFNPNPVIPGPPGYSLSAFLSAQFDGPGGFTLGSGDMLVVAAPEPTSMVLCLTGLPVLGGLAWRRRKKKLQERAAEAA